jgi:hypothetical protein
MHAIHVTIYFCSFEQIDKSVYWDNSACQYGNNGELYAGGFDELSEPFEGMSQGMSQTAL